MTNKQKPSERVKREPKYGVTEPLRKFLWSDKEKIDIHFVIDMLEHLIKMHEEYQRDVLTMYSEVKGTVKGSRLKTCPFPNEEVDIWRLYNLNPFIGGLIRTYLACFKILKKQNDKQQTKK